MPIVRVIRCERRVSRSTLSGLQESIRSHSMEIEELDIVQVVHLSHTILLSEHSHQIQIVLDTPSMDGLLPQAEELRLQRVQLLRIQRHSMLSGHQSTIRSHSMGMDEHDIAHLPSLSLIVQRSELSHRVHSCRTLPSTVGSRHQRDELRSQPVQ